MIDKNLFLKIVNKGIGITEYLFLYYLNTNIDIKEMVTNVKTVGLVTMMVNKGLIIKIKDQFRLTDKGVKVLKSVEDAVVINTPIINLIESDQIYQDMIKEFKAKLKSLIQKEQIKGFGGVYFIPTETELRDSLKRFWKKYPTFKDFNRITNIINEHIEECIKKNNIAPAIKYFVFKDGMSRLAGAYENNEGNSIGVEAKANPKSTKHLF
jgi:predicted transcriptional regulator